MQALLVDQRLTVLVCLDLLFSAFFRRLRRLFTLWWRAAGFGLRRVEALCIVPKTRRVSIFVSVQQRVAYFLDGLHDQSAEVSFATGATNDTQHFDGELGTLFR